MITREDETDLDNLELFNNVIINFTSITECNTTRSIPGLMCGNQCSQYNTPCGPCLEPYEWCRKESPISCGNFRLNNKQLCSNTTFWTGKTCDLYDLKTRRKEAVGRRCTGASQHCIYPWYTSSLYFYEVHLGGGR